ncbi:hypothetical protein [Streptomyces sp. NPDC096105]|uniref:hypothetical protein n=1 Tax=Streptomyces sp. NPDC096105 TaxID=3366074 RepID=UPI003818B656
MATAVAAGAAGLAVGVVGGMVAAEAVDEIGDFFEGCRRPASGPPAARRLIADRTPPLLVPSTLL